MPLACVSMKGRTTLLVLLGGFCELSYRFLKEKHLLCKTPFELFTQFLNGSSVVIFDGSKIIGHVTLWPLAKGWQEAGSIWVRPEYRGRGIAKRLLEAILAAHDEEKILLTTTNPIIMQLSESVGLRMVNFATLSHEVHRATCVCSAKKREARCYPDCRLQNTECKLFVN